MIIMIEIGSYARYKKTGTVGTVTRFVEQHGHTFGELDSTGLLYRADQLVQVMKDVKVPSEKTREDDIKKLINEKESVSEDFNDAVFQQDGACHGGG